MEVVADHRLPQALPLRRAPGAGAPHGPGLKRLRGGGGRGDSGRRRRCRRGRWRSRPAAALRVPLLLLLLLLLVPVRFGLAVCFFLLRFCRGVRGRGRAEEVIGGGDKFRGGGAIKAGGERNGPEIRQKKGCRGNRCRGETKEGCARNRKTTLGGLGGREREGSSLHTFSEVELFSFVVAVVVVLSALALFLLAAPRLWPL